MSSRPDVLDDPVFGRLEWEGPWWTGRMRFPALAACQIRWQLTRDERMVRSEAVPDEGDGSVRVVVEDEASNGPDDPQRAAFGLLMTNQDQVAANIFADLVFGMRHYSSFVRSPFELDAERLGLVSVGGVRELVALYEIHFLEQVRESESYVIAEFTCCWDHEHGISLLLHHGQVVACGGGGEFCNRGSMENLEAHAKYCAVAASSPGQAVTPAAGAKRYFEFVAGSSRKFWEISLSGTDVTTRWGRMGTDGQSKTRAFQDAAAAKKVYDKLIADKTRKGYSEK